MITVEHIKDGEDHINVNSGFVGVITLKYPQEKIYIFSGIKHFSKIKEYLNKNNINTNNLINHKINPFNNFLRDYKLILFDLFIVIKVFYYAIKYRENKIIFLYTTTFLLYYIKLLCILFPYIQVTCCLHGDLERIDLNTYANSFSKNKLLMYLYALIFGLKTPLSLYTPKNLKYIVFGESIKDNTIRIIPSIKDKILAVPHPYFYGQSSYRNKHNCNKKINLGIVGLSSKRKNIPYLYKLLNRLDKIENKNFTLSFSGKILDEKFFNFVKSLSFVDKENLSMNFIPEDIKYNKIKNMDYVLFTYQLNSYKFIASGAFMDSINFEKPVIAITTDYIKYYFNKYGNIGYLLNSYEEFENKILSIINNFPEQDYQKQIENIEKIKKAESLKNLTKYI